MGNPFAKGFCIRANFCCRVYVCCCCASSPAEIVRDRLVRARDTLSLVINALSNNEQNILRKITALTQEATMFRNNVMKFYEARKAAQAQHAPNQMDVVALQTNLTLAAKTCRMLAYAHRENLAVERKIADAQRKFDTLDDAIRNCEYKASMASAIELLREVGLDRPLDEKRLEQVMRGDLTVYTNIEKVNTSFTAALKSGPGDSEYVNDTRYDPESMIKALFKDIPLDQGNWMFINSEIHRVPDKDPAEEEKEKEHSRLQSLRRIDPRGHASVAHDKASLLVDPDEIKRRADAQRAQFVISDDVADQYGVSTDDIVDAALEEREKARAVADDVNEFDSSSGSGRVSPTIHRALSAIDEHGDEKKEDSESIHAESLPSM